jgi:flagellar motor component MotA
MLKETYVAKLKTLNKDAIKIDVGYPSIFAPNEKLLSDFNNLKWKLMEKGMKEIEARKKAWDNTNFENRYIEKITSNKKIIEKLKEIKKLSKDKDVYLYCYCGKPLCHRFILMDIIKEI